MDSDTSVVFGNYANTVIEMRRPVIYLYHELRELCPRFCSDKENSPVNFLFIVGIWIYMMGVQAVDFAKLHSSIKVKQ